jgi:hypothetical protein
MYLEEKNLKNDIYGFDMFLKISINNCELEKRNIILDEEFVLNKSPKVTVLATEYLDGCIKIEIDFKHTPDHNDYSLYNGSYKESFEDAIKKIEEFLIDINSVANERTMFSIRSSVECNNSLVKSSKFGEIGISCTEYFMLVEVLERNDDDTIRNFMKKLANMSQHHNSFDGLISLNDAAKKYDKAVSTLKTNIANGKFKEGRDVAKFGNSWVFKESALMREYVFCK